MRYSSAGKAKLHEALGSAICMMCGNIVDKTKKRNKRSIAITTTPWIVKWCFSGSFLLYPIHRPPYVSM